MKLVRYGAKGEEKPGLIDKSGQLRDLSPHLKDLTGEAYSPQFLAKLAALDPSKLSAVSGNPRLGAPVTGISKFVAIGLNYSDQGNRQSDSIRADLLPESQHVPVRPERRGGEAARLDQARLGG
jgi:2,4-didehydro-3-deoxy-L-rhamnonate hydrolase